MTLRFKSAHIKELSWYPLDDGSKFVLQISAPLYAQIAEQLNSKGLCYSDDGVPRKFEGNIGLPVSINGGDCVLGDRTFTFERYWKLKVGRREEAPDSDITLWLTMRLHLDGADPLIHAFCTGVGKGEFSFEISPAQGAFEFMEDTTATPPAAAKPEANGQEPITKHLRGEALAEHTERQRGRAKPEARA